MNAINATAAAVLGSLTVTLPAQGQTVVDNSIIGSMYAGGLIETLGKNLEDPRSAQLKSMFNGQQPGVLCGQMSYTKASGEVIPFTLFMADTTYKKLLFLTHENASQFQHLCLPPGYQ